MRSVADGRIMLVLSGNYYSVVDMQENTHIARSLISLNKSQI